VQATAWLPQELRDGVNTMDLEIYQWILIAAFIGIVVWAFGQKRKARFNKDAKIPFEDGKD
jgi:cytochrome c oxidase cbb3-type subunit IV